jgi:hypothetical protein
MENRSKWSKMTDANLKAIGKGERTSKKVSTIRKADGTSFRRKNANQYGAAEGGNDYTEKRVNRTDRFDLGGTADSADKGADIGGTLGSSMYGRGGHVSKGEMVWKKLSSSDKMNFLIKNFKNQITDRSKEDVVNKTYNFLPKIVKIKLESEYANVEDYANGGGTGVSSQTGFAEGTNADLLMNQDYLAYKKGGGVGNLSSNAQKVLDRMAKAKVNRYKVYDFTVKQWADELKIKLSKEEIEKVVEIYSTNPKYSFDFDKMANGGGLANVPESFPETDAMSYKNGGGIEEKIMTDIYATKNGKHVKVNEKPMELREAEKWVKKQGIEKYYTNIDFKFISKYANGGSTKGFEYTIGGL